VVFFPRWVRGCKHSVVSHDCGRCVGFMNLVDYEGKVCLVVNAEAFTGWALRGRRAKGDW
jgi:hypothetical protein